MSAIVNPYIAGAPVTEQRMFFGREDIFQWIENSIAGQYADHILVIHGQRRVGKTSVLKQLGNRLPKRYIPVFFDLQGRTHTTLDRFLWWLAREIVRVLKQERGIEVSLPEKEDFARDLEHFENRFLPDLQPILNGSTLLLTFDEFDNLEDSEIKEELGRPLVDHLRRLMGSPGLNFIFSIGSSGRKLENMQASYTGFFKTALYKKISFLNEEQTHGLITRPVKGVLEYERAAVERIYQIASGHPYFTQLTCHELFARCQRTEQRRVAESDVEAILEDVVERGTVNLKFVWDEAMDIEKWSLSALAHLDKNKSDTRAVAEYLRKQHVRFSESDLTSGLLRLREKDVLTPENHFVIHLLRLWLQKNRPIEQAREELTEVNPIANRYIEIGLEFKDSRLYEKAVESFQEALAISKDNLQAQVNIALTYMDQKLYDKAIVEFEKALTMDDEDVSARAGLCEAHLALGDAAMSRSRMKDAVLSYQRVLAINAEHTEARGRMAEISCQRAEKALLNGKDEDALAAFTEALKFTPEDPKLIARVEQFREEKKSKILALLLASSEKEAEAGNWDAAIKSLEEALPLSPSDMSIPQKLVDARVTQQKVQALAAVYADAQKAYTEKNYDQAVGLFKKIILEDENYRDASRLLTQAIELRRTAPKWWQKLPVKKVAAQPRSRIVVKPVSRRVWVAGGILAVAVLGVGTAFWFGLFDAPAAVPTQIVSPSTSTVAAPVSALYPEVQVALDTIQSEEPLYHTSFDDWDSNDTGSNAALVNGKLILTSEDEIGATLSLNAFSSDSYAVEFELNISGDASSDGLCVYEVSNNAQDNEESWRAMSALFFSGGQTELDHYVHPGQVLELVIGDDIFDFSKSSLVTLIFLGDQITAFINGQLAYTAQDPAGSTVFLYHGLSAYNQVTCEFDHFKYWDLRDMDPAVKSALATIQSEEPLYQTSFDSWEFGEPEGNTKTESGKLIVTSENQQHAGANLYNLISDKYAVQFDLRVLDISPEGHCIFETGDGGTGGSYRAISAEFYEDNRAVLSHHIGGGIHEALAESSYNETIPNTVTLIILGDQIAAFINGNFAYAARDTDGNALYASQGLSANNTAQCEYDNFKIWDLRGLNPATLTALAAIQSEEPIYQTSFDTWDFGDPVENARVENGKLIVTSPGEHVGVDANTPDSDRFAVQFDVRMSEASPEGHCIFYTDGNKDDGLPMGIITGFHMNGESNLAYVLGPDSQDDLAYSAFDASGTNKVTLVIIDDQIAAFFNERLAYAARNPRGGAVYGNSIFAASHTIKCEYDNYKYWDLSGMDFSTSTETTPVPTTSASQQPAWVTEFAEPILVAISGQSPHVQDDIGTATTPWLNYHDGAQFKRIDGEMITSTSGGSNYSWKMWYTDFVIKLDYRFLPSATRDQNRWTILFRGAEGFTFYYNGDVDVIRYLQQGKSLSNAAQSVGSVNHVLILVKDGAVALFINDQPVYYGDLPSGYKSGEASWFFGANIAFDNFEIWNLNDIQEQP